MSWWLDRGVSKQFLPSPLLELLVELDVKMFAEVILIVELMLTTLQIMFVDYPQALLAHMKKHQLLLRMKNLQLQVFQSQC